MNTILLRCCLVVLTLLTAARAEDVVSNLANDANAQIVLDAGGESAAQAFTSGPQPRTLDRIVVRLRGFQTGPHNARVKLWLGAGAVPETLVEDLGTAVNIPIGTDGDMTVLSAARPVLAANTRYWVSVTNVDGDFDWLNTSDQASTGTGAVVQARAESATGNAGSWSVFGSAANFQFMRVETRSALAVTTDADAGPGSLRQAVADAATLGGPDFILFDPSLSGKTITLTSGQIVVNSDVTIDATALPGGITISGNNASRIFFVDGGVTAAMHGLTLTGGSSGNGGAVFNDNSTLTLTRCTLTGNSAGFGGAIVSTTADVTGPITSSTTLVYCTLSGNTASAIGGAILNNLGRTALTHCTVTGNTAPEGTGSGVVGFGDDATETVVRGCIISGNTNSSVDFVGGDSFNSFTSLGSNLIGSGNATGDFNQPGDLINNAPLLAALGNYGGPTRTMPPLSTSPAVNAALGFPGATDQRGLAIGDYVYENDFATSELKGANVVLFNAATGAGTVNGGSFLLTPAAQSQVVSLVLPEPGAFNTFAASFDLRYTDPSGGTGNGGPADGMSFSFGPKPPAGLYTAEDGPPGAHRVSFNIFNSNGGVGRLKYIRPNGTEGAAVDFPRFGDAGDFRAFTVTLDTAGTLRVTYKGALVFTVPNIGYTYQPGDTFTFAARTGGDVSEQRVDNIGIVTDPPEGRPDIGAVEGGLFPAGFAPVVTSAADTFGTGTGGLTLREAVDLAPSGSTITFAPAVFTGATPATNTITLGSTLPNLTRAVTIDATALPVGVTISGNNARRIFTVLGSGGSPSVSLRGLTLTGGNAAFGGAISLSGATLALERCTLHGNTAPNGNGGAINGESGENLTLTHCTLTDNSATSGTGLGGAICVLGSLTLRHCTVTDNTAFFGGGVQSSGSGTFTLENSIVARNSASTGSDISINGSTIARVDANLVQGFAKFSGSIVMGPEPIPADPLLAPLGNYGGPTPTMPPLFGSPALDAAVGSTETLDQRGLPRAADADGNGTAVADIGAVELQVRLVTTADDENDGIGVGAGTSLREAIADASGASDIVRFAPAVFTGATPATNTISLGSTSGVPAITVSNRAVSVDASDIPSGVTIDDGSATNYGLFRVTSGSILAFRGVTLANGGGLISGGGAVLVDANGTLTLDRCTLSGNEVIIPPAFGGAIHNSGILALTSCTLSGNSAQDLGGAIANFGKLTLTHCTLTANSGFTGGAITNRSGATMNLSGTIVAGNTADFSPDIDNEGTITPTGVNFIGDTAGSGLTASGTLLTGDARLDPAAPADHGGPTQTHALLPGSPARDAAVGSTATSDQRGFPILGTADIGAYETQIGPIANATTDEDTVTGALGFTVGQVSTLSVSSGNTALVPDANIALGGSGAARTVTVTPAPDASGGATITLTDSLTGETQSFFVLVLAVNDPPVFTAGPRQFVFVDSGARVVPGWATGIAAGPANESAQTLAFNVGNDNAALFATPPAIAANGTLTFTPAAGVTGRATVTVSLGDNGAPVATSAEQSFIIAVRLLNPQSTVLLAKGSPAPGAGVFPGLPADAVLASFRPPATSDSGDVAFVAKWTSATGPVKRGTGLFLNDKCLAIVGGDASAIAAGARWRSFSDPVVDAGHAVCIAKLSGVAASSSSIIVGNLTGAALEKIALSGEVAPGVGGAKFRSFKSVTVLGARVAFLAQLATGTGTPRVTPGSDFGLWYHEPGNPRFIVRESDVVAGRTIRTLVAFKAGNGSPGAGRGTMVLSTISGDPVVGALAFFTDGTRGIISQDIDDGPPSLAVTLSGDVATGVDTGATFASYGPPARNRDETTAFLAKLTLGAGVTRADASGIFTGTDGGGKFATVIRTGVNAVSGAKFSALKDPVLASDGALAFPATIRGGTVRGAAMQTLWTKPFGQPLALLAQGGAPATELTGSKWKSFKSLAIAADRGPIFTATLAPRGSGVWANDFTGALRLLFNTGATVGGKKVKSFKLLSATVGSPGVTRSFNDNAQVVWLATFTDKTTAIVTTEVP